MNKKPTRTFIIQQLLDESNKNLTKAFDIIKMIYPETKYFGPIRTTDDEQLLDHLIISGKKIFINIKNVSPFIKSALIDLNHLFYTNPFVTEIGNDNTRFGWERTNTELDKKLMELYGI